MASVFFSSLHFSLLDQRGKYRRKIDIELRLMRLWCGGGQG